MGMCTLVPSSMGGRFDFWSRCGLVYWWQGFPVGWPLLELCPQSGKPPRRHRRPGVAGLRAVGATTSSSIISGRRTGRRRRDPLAAEAGGTLVGGRSSLATSLIVGRFLDAGIPVACGLGVPGYLTYPPKIPTYLLGLVPRCLSSANRRWERGVGPAAY